MSGKVIFVTGARSAFIQYLITHLLKYDFNIIAVTRKMTPSHRKDIHWVECDLIQPNLEHVDWAEIDIIIHAAGVSNTLNESEMEKLNVGSTRYLSSIAKKWKIHPFIYISSIFASTSCGKYGLSKWKAEEWIRKTLDHYIIFRSSQLYGYGPDNPIDRLVQRIAQKKFVLCPTGDGHNIKPLYYEDLALILLTVIMDQKSINSSLFYVLGPDSFSYRELVQRISKTLQRKPVVVLLPQALMVVMEYILLWFKIPIGVYPDQIRRFYSQIPEPEIPVYPLTYKKFSEYLHAFCMSDQEKS